MKTYLACAPGYDAKTIESKSSYDAHFLYFMHLKNGDPDFDKPPIIMVWRKSEKNNIRFFAKEKQFSLTYEEFASMAALGTSTFLALIKRIGNEAAL